MGPFAAGQIIVLPFPFSDLSHSKYRPALLLAPAGRGDWLACQITSNPYSDPAPVMLREEDFAAGTLAVVSYARPAKLFTANEELFASIPARAKANKLDEVKESVIALLRGEGG